MKTKNALKHDKQRKAQRDDKTHTNHTELKTTQIKKFIPIGEYNILELFAGNGKLSELWKTYGNLQTNEGKDAYRLFHGLIHQGKKYDIIDLDPYGFPSRFFPDIFLLIDDGYMTITFPHPAVNVLNGITKQTFMNYYGEECPKLETVISKIKQYALCHWRDVKILDITNMGRVNRICMRVKRVKATEYCGVRNR